jgi:hypothetical protein
MQTLPVIPVETLARALRANEAPRNDNPGIVPPWLDRPRNPGIVPPWMQYPPVAPEQPVDDDTPRILGATQPTVYDPQPIVGDDDQPRIWG